MYVQVARASSNGQFDGIWLTNAEEVEIAQ